MLLLYAIQSILVSPATLGPSYTLHRFL